MIRQYLRLLLLAEILMLIMTAGCYTTRGPVLPSAEVEEGALKWRTGFGGFRSFDSRKSREKLQESIICLNLSGMYGATNTRGTFFSFSTGRFVSNSAYERQDFRASSVGAGLVFEIAGKTLQEEKKKTSISLYLGLELSYQEYKYKNLYYPEDDENWTLVLPFPRYGAHFTVPVSGRLCFEFFSEILPEFLASGAGVVYRLTDAPASPSLAVDLTVNPVREGAEQWMLSVGLLW